MRLRPTIAALSFLLCNLLAAAAARACIWDDDSLRTEAQGLPGLTEIITGRFDRFPPLYYEMRLTRSRAELEADPRNWNAYDNAGVSCDRLGLHDDAVALLRLKLERLREAGIDAAATDPEARNHYYRACANLGTLLAHRWIKVGRKAQDLSDLREGRDWIAKAIEVNPDAHFGREKYQLLAMEWLIEGYESHASEQPAAPNESGRVSSQFFGIPYKKIGLFPDDAELASRFPDAPEGLAGLIALGAAWESLDVFEALALVLDARGDASLSYLARLRCAELIESGAQSLHPAVSNSKQSQLNRIDRFGATAQAQERIEAFYKEARAEADAWRQHRNEFIVTQLNLGRHPDTYPDFWMGYTEASAPPSAPDWTLSSPSRDQVTERYRVAIVALIVIGAIGVLIGIPAAILLRKARRAAGPFRETDMTEPS